MSNADFLGNYSLQSCTANDWLRGVHKGSDEHTFRIQLIRSMSMLRKLRFRCCSFEEAKDEFCILRHSHTTVFVLLERTTVADVLISTLVQSKSSTLYALHFSHKLSMRFFRGNFWLQSRNLCMLRNDTPTNA